MPWAIAAAAMAAVSAGMQARGQRQAAEYQSKVEKNNAKALEYEAQVEAQRGHEAQQDKMMETSQMRGKATASLAARGLSLESGSALSLLEDVDYIGDIDKSRLKTNADRAVWGKRVGATNAMAQAGLYKHQAKSISPLLSATSAGLSSYAGSGGTT